MRVVGGKEHFFIDNPGGSGKTYLENLLLKSVRGQGHIALAVASLGCSLGATRGAHRTLSIQDSD